MAEPTPITRQQPPSRVTSTKAEDGRDTSLNLDQRMLAVLAEIGYLPKTGTGPEAQGSYKFVRVEHIKDAVRDALVKYGVMVYTSFPGVEVELVPAGDRTRVKAVVQGWMRFTNVDKPEDICTVEITGMAIDTSDKAIAKAMTSADKYGLLNTFQIPTGDDPDETGETLPATERRAAPPRESSEAPRPERSSPPATGAQGGPEDECPKHHKPWKPGRYGYYCPAKDDSTERGYCNLKPSKEWAAAHER